MLKISRTARKNSSFQSAACDPATALAVFFMPVGRPSDPIEKEQRSREEKERRIAKTCNVPALELRTARLSDFRLTELYNAASAVERSARILHRGFLLGAAATAGMYFFGTEAATFVMGLATFFSSTFLVIALSHEEEDLRQDVAKDLAGKQEIPGGQGPGFRP